jgi:hypothetical protein
MIEDWSLALGFVQSLFYFIIFLLLLLLLLLLFYDNWKFAAKT